MGQSETFEHTADLGLRVTGTDLADLFQAAAEGLFDAIVVNRHEIREVESESVSLVAETLPDLLLAWLNELIFRSETRHRVYRRFELTVTENPPRLEATIFGEPIDRDRHVLDHEVKAATHHGVRFEQGPNGWIAEVIVDI